MRWHRVWCGAVAVAVLAAGAGCGTGEGDGAGEGGPPPSEPSPEAADTADVVCTMLRDWNNDISGVMNDTSQTVTDQDDPDTAADVLVSGFTEMIGLAREHRAQVDGLELPAVVGREQLVDELAGGADESIAVLQDERAHAADLGPVPLEEQGGAIGGAFTGVERALSVIEPQIGAYDADLQQAFRTDEDCTHVIQPF
jgi:hypothetical protein